MSKWTSIGKPKRIMSIDASTNSIAFAVFDNDKLLHFGKINFEGNTHFEKAGDACRKLIPFFNEIKVNSLVIESTIYTNSPKTSMQLALVQGAIFGAAAASLKIKSFYSCVPVAWQSWIGNKNLTKAEKLAIKEDHPGKSANWYKNYEREFRKNRTIRLVNIEFMTDISDNDIADAVAIGWYAVNNWNKVNKVDS